MFCVYEMCCDKGDFPASDIECIPFSNSVFEQYKEQYEKAYNEAFFPMRKALNIKPYEWFSNGGAKLIVKPDVYVLIENNNLIGSVGCYRNEVDDLFVNPSYMKNGYGRKLLVWAMNHIKEQGHKKIVLHVAEWNEAAIKMYLNEGFIITGKETIKQ